MTVRVLVQLSEAMRLTDGHDVSLAWFIRNPMAMATSLCFGSKSLSAMTSRIQSRRSEPKSRTCLFAH